MHFIYGWYWRKIFIYIYIYIETCVWYYSEIINVFLFKKNLKIKVKNIFEDKQFLKFPLIFLIFMKKIILCSHGNECVNEGEKATRHNTDDIIEELFNFTGFVG